MVENDKIDPLTCTAEEASLFLQDVAFMMEEMANGSKEEHGKREPGERCMYEIQRERSRQSTVGEGFYG